MGGEKLMNLLINPSSMNMQRYGPPPLGLLYLAAMDEETEIFDDALRPSPGFPGLEKLSPRVVGVPIYTKGRHNSLEYLRWAKERGAVTVAGGPHVAVMTKQLVEHYGDFVDHFVVGDGELAWKAICNGEDIPQVVEMRVEDLDTLPLPAWEKIDISRYPPRIKKGFGIHRNNDLPRIPRIPVILGRGCTGHCTFCSAWWVNGKLRYHGKEWMAVHLARLWELGVRHLSFQDDCLTTNRQAVMELCNILEGYTFSWTGVTRADLLDTELAQRMESAGCYMLAFGIESGSQVILDKMHKQIDLSKAFVAREACRQANIHFRALMIRNFPYSTPETNQETARFLKKLQPDDTGSVGATWVFPGTVLYQQCKRAGLIDDSFWLGDKPYYVYHGGLE